jgi:hypothetical protein
MKTQPVNSPGTHESPQSGVALVLTLLIISMLVVVVVGFVSVSRLEQMAARNYTYQTAAEQMAQRATGQAMERLAAALAAGTGSGMYATQPGMVHLSGGATEPLYSQGANATNINALMTNGFVTGNASDAINVEFATVQNAGGPPIGRVAFYIVDETVKLPVNHASARRNHLNAVAPRPFSIRGVDVNVPNEAVASFSNLLAGSFSNNTISNWSYFFIPEQLAQAVSGIGPVRSRRVTVANETNASFFGRTPWRTAKIEINNTNPSALPLLDASVGQLVQRLTDSRLTDLFGGHFGDKYGAAGVQQLAANMLQLRSGYWSADYVSPANRSFGRALPTNESIVLGASSVPARADRPLAANAGLAKKTHGVPQDFLGYVPFPMLAEVAVGGLEYGFSGAPGDNNMTLRFFVACKLFNPFPVAYPAGGEILVQIDKARVRMTNGNPSTLSANINEQIWRGPDGSHRNLTPGYNDMPDGGGASPWDPWGHGSGVAQDRAEPPIPPGTINFPPPLRSLTPANGIARANIPTIRAGSTTNVFIPFTIVTSARDETTGLYTGPNAEMYVIIDHVRLLATPGQANTVRDWCSGPDMRAAFGQPSTAQFRLPVSGISRQGNFADGDYSPRTTPASLAPVNWVAIAKLDPRMKAGHSLAESAAVWRVTPATLETNSLAFGPDDFLTERVPADPAYANDSAMAVFNTNLPPVMALPGSRYGMAADLGKVFTGLPWRTLRMQPQPVSESQAGLIPDWVLLDMIGFGTNAQAFTPVNPNISYAVSGGGSVEGFGAGLRSQLTALTDAQARTQLADPLTGTLSAGVTIPAAVGTNQQGIANLLASVATLTNNGNWAAGDQGWKRRRDELQFPPGALLLPSEITEVNGFANYVPAADVNAFKANEYRLGALIPGMETKSRFFKIYAVGEAFQGTSQQVAATALLQTLVEVDDTTTPPTITTIYQYPPAE